LRIRDTVSHSVFLFLIDGFLDQASSIDFDGKFP